MARIRPDFELVRTALAAPRYVNICNGARRRLSGNLQWFDLPVDTPAYPGFSDPQIVQRLQVEPEFSAGAEIPRQTERCIGANTPFATNNLIQPAHSNTESFS